MNSEKQSLKLSMSCFDKDDVVNVLKYFQCCLCSGVLQNTVVCEMGHFFCNACLVKYMENSNSCPKNNYHLLEGKNIKRTKQIDEIIDLLTVNCKHRREGCYWKGKLKYLNLHLKEECRYVPKQQQLAEDMAKLLRTDDKIEESEIEEEDLVVEEEDLEVDEEISESRPARQSATVEVKDFSQQRESEQDISEQESFEEESENEEMEATHGNFKQEEYIEEDLEKNVNKDDSESDELLNTQVRQETGLVAEFTRRLKQLCLEDSERKELCSNFVKLKEFMFNKFDELHSHLDKQEAGLDRQNRLIDDNKDTKRVIPCLLKHESIMYRNRSIEMNVLAEKKAHMIVLDIPTSAGSFSIEMQVFCKIRKGWIALGVCDANVAKSQECEFHKNNFKGYAIFTTNGYCFNGYENSAYQVEFQREVNYRTILRLSYESKTKTVTLFFRDQEIEMEVKTDAVLYPVVMFFGDSSRLVIIN